ncbi:MAG: ArsR family transcriptional regulator [Candidatus Aenigmarchaeota archaeon]|nr:ArsR family transcriptional regulator [Candidatus Aenigmarchaeota archaeon]
MEKEFKISRRMLKVVTADTRIDILRALEERPMTASELSRHLNKHVTTVSEHLNILEKSDLIERVERPGRKWVYYKISNSGKKLLHPGYNRVVIFLSISVILIAGLALISSYYFIQQPISQTPETLELEPFAEAMNSIETLEMDTIDLELETEVEMEILTEEEIDLKL